jgi:hypothetical protein
MGLLKDIGNAISNVASKAVSVVSEVVSTIGKNVVEKSVEFLKVATQTLQVVTKVVESIAQQLNIIKAEDNVEDLGDKSLRAEKTSKEFEVRRDYIDYLKNEIKSQGKEELEKLTPQERLARRVIGTSILSKAIEEEYSTEISVGFWEKAIQAGLSSQEIQELITKFTDVGIKPEEFVKYLNKELSFKEEDTIECVLLESYKQLEPQANTKELEEKILSMQRKTKV